MAKKVFKERQLFRNVEFFAFAAGLSALLLFILVQEIRTGTNTMYEKELTCIFLIATIIMAVFYALQVQLKTVVTTSGISFQIMPIHLKKIHIPWEDVAYYEIVETSNMAQWAGANITFNYEKRYSFSGRNGVRITLKNGAQYLIGSRKTEDLTKAIQAVFPK